VNPASARTWIVCCLVAVFSGIMLPLGAMTKNSEVLETDPSATFGAQPPLSVDVEVSPTMWKSTVAPPSFLTVMLREFCVSAAEVISK